MKTTAALAVLACVLAGPAYADDTITAFKTFCIEPHANADLALALADKAGWMPLPKTMLAGFPRGMFVDPQARLHTDESAFSMLVLAHGSLPGANEVAAHICAIAVLPGGVPNLADEAAALAGVPPDDNLSKPGQTAYAWLEKDGTHVAVPHDSAGLKALIESGAVNFLITRVDDKMTMIMLFVTDREAI